MALPAKRRSVTRNSVRKAWQENPHWIDEYGFSEYALEAVVDDCDEIRICWCCGRTGYQEVAHIIPHSLGGSGLPFNCFLLCAECHIASPDCNNAKYFVGFINQNAGKANKVFVEVFEKISKRLTNFMEREPECGEAMLDYMKSNEFDFGSNITTHGASLSLSTKMACIEMFVDDAIDSVRKKVMPRI